MSRAEKFIEEHTKKSTNEIGVTDLTNSHNYHEWLTPDQAREAVEIAREEMIEKACEYLDGLIDILNDRGHQLKKERIIGGLKQAMEDENTD